MNKIKFILLFLLFFYTNVGFCNSTVNQTISCNLPLILEIEKIIVENMEYDIDEFMSNVKIKNMEKINNEKYILTLTPVSVKISTNAKSPIIVYADFTSLEHSKKAYSFKKNNISIYPDSYTINNPYNHIKTKNFTPYIVLTKDTEIGLYNGILTFTLGIL